MLGWAMGSATGLPGLLPNCGRQAELGIRGVVRSRRLRILWGLKRMKDFMSLFRELWHGLGKTHVSRKHEMKRAVSLPTDSIRRGEGERSAVVFDNDAGGGLDGLAG